MNPNRIDRWLCPECGDESIEQGVCETCDEALELDTRTYLERKLDSQADEMEYECEN
jgi:hypothetical protein